MKVSVIRSAVIDAPIDRVWTVLRDFNSHERWHPAVTSSRMENDLDGDVVGGFGDSASPTAPSFVSSCCATATGSTLFLTASSTRLCLYLTMWPRSSSSR